MLYCSIMYSQINKIFAVGKGKFYSLAKERFLKISQTPLLGFTYTRLTKTFEAKLN